MPIDKERRRAWQRERYHRLKLEDPDTWEAKQKQKRVTSSEWYKTKRAEDPKWVAENQKYQREYRSRKRVEDPEEVNSKWNAWRAKKQAEDPEHIQDRDRNGWLHQRYGISQKDYEILYMAQDGKCAICGRSKPNGGGARKVYLFIDHCHKTGEIRGLLCNTCNAGIGYLKDDPELLRRALDYLT